MPVITGNEFLGKVALVTGASSGIGEALTLEMAKAKAKVIMLVRSKVCGLEAIKRIQAEYPAADLSLVVADLSLASSVSQFCNKFNERVDILVNNAGVYSSPYNRNKEGVESVMATNHLGHFLLTCLMLSRDLISTTARIILVTGAYYKKGSRNVATWDAWTPENYNKKLAYSNSKLAVCLFALWLRSAVRQILGSSAKVFAVHPGMVNTNIARHMEAECSAPCRVCMQCIMAVIMQSPRKGCQGLLMLAADHNDARRSGTYFHNGKEEAWIKEVLDDDLVMRCWDFSFQWVQRSVTDSTVINKLKALRQLPRLALADLGH